MTLLIPRSLGVLALATVLALSGVAAAQTAELTVNATQDSATVTGGQSVTVPFEVNLYIDEYSCSQPQDIDVGLSVTGVEGISGSADPANLTFSVGQGPYSSELMMAYDETQSADVSIEAPSGTTSGFSADVTVTGSFPGGDGAPNCAPGALPSDESEAAVTVNVQADQTGGTNGDGGTGTDGGDGGTNGNGSGNTSDDENGSPMPAWIVPLSLVSAAMIASRLTRR